MRNKFILVTCLLLALFTNISLACTKEPTNLFFVERGLMQYHDSGQYVSQINKVIREAKYYLQFRINDNKRLAKPSKLAIVLDIDETSLSNYQDMKKLRFGGSNKDFADAEKLAHDPAIEATRSLFNFAKANGVAVFFVTGRKDFLRKYTEKNLAAAGYKGWDGLFLKPNNYHKSSVIPYKTAMRKKITEQGYDIALNIGDQESDLKGGYADFALKLPDPYYYIR